MDRPKPGPEADTYSQPEVFKISEDGIICSGIDEVKKYLDRCENPAEALAAILTRVDHAIQAKEKATDGVREFVEFVNKKSQWLDGHPLAQGGWRYAYPDIATAAEQDKDIQSKRCDDEAALAAMGISGPRLNNFLQNSSSSLLHAVRNQICLRGFNYPLVCCLANVKTYDRIVSSPNGVQKTPETQPIDVQNLDVVEFRRLTDDELARANIIIGPAGLIVPKGSSSANATTVVDPGFDAAVASFRPGLLGSQQAAGKATPKTNSVVNPATFAFSETCTCEEGVPQGTLRALDDLRLNSRFAVINSIADDLVKYRHSLCARHCQRALLYGLGVHSVTVPSNLAFLREQLVHDLRDLRAFLVEHPTMQAEFDKFKSKLGAFSWAGVEEFNNQRNR
jgi:hypothetical protein